MLYLSLVPAMLQLLAVNMAARRSRVAVATIILIAIGFTFLLPFLFGGLLIFPVVSIQGLLLIGSAVAWHLARGGPSAFLRLSVASTMAAYGFGAWLGYRDMCEFDRLRARYPLVPMASRVPAPRPAPDEGKPGDDAGARLERLERFDGGSFRTGVLHMLHERTFRHFIDSPGFGVARMLRPSETLLSLHRNDPVPQQPGEPILFHRSDGELAPVDAEPAQPLGKLLDDSIIDFADDWGFGYVKAGRLAAGFEPHRFSEVPKPEALWRVRTLELASLLLHEEPVVYVSSELPRMDRVHDAPTRPLDRFEGPALEALRRGDDLYVARDGELVRMLGAVRSGRACVACHGGERGALLGAFSYVLEPADESSSTADTPAGSMDPDQSTHP